MGTVYLTSTSGGPGTPTAAHWSNTLDASAPGASNISNNVSNTGTPPAEIDYAYYAAGAGVIGTGTFTVEVVFNTTDADLGVVIQLHRVNSSGTVQSSHTASSEQSGAADRTFTFTSVDLGTWAAGDYLRVDFQQVGNGAHGNAIADYAIGSTGTRVVYPDAPADVTLDADINSASTVTAAMVRERAIAGTIAAAATTTAAMVREREVAGTVASASSITADLTVQADVFLEGTVAALSSITAAVIMDLALAGTVVGASSTTAAVTVDLALSGTVAAAASTTAALAVERALAGTIASSSSISADVTVEKVVLLEATVAAASTVTALLSAHGAPGDPFYLVDARKISGVSDATALTDWYNEGTLGGKMTEATNKPTYYAAGGPNDCARVYFKNDVLISASFNRSQPFTMAAVWRYDTTDAGTYDPIQTNNTQYTGYIQRSSGNMIYGTNVERSVSGAAPTAGEWAWYIVQFNGVSSTFLDDRGNSDSGNTGTNNLSNGVRLGRNNPGTRVLDGDILLAGWWDDGTTEAQIQSYFENDPDISKITGVPLAANLAPASTFTAAAVVERGLAGTVAATSSSTAGMSAELAIAGAANAVSSMTAGMGVDLQLQATTAAVSSVAAALVRERGLGATIAALSSVVADLTVDLGGGGDVLLEATVAALGSLVADATRDRQIAGGVTTASFFFGDMGVDAMLAATIASVSAMEALTFDVVVYLAASIAAASSVAAGLDRERAIEAVIGAVSSVSADMTRDINLGGEVAGAASFEGLLGRERPIAAAIAGAVSIWARLNYELPEEPLYAEITSSTRSILEETVALYFAAASIDEATAEVTSSTQSTITVDSNDSEVEDT